MADEYQDIPLSQLRLDSKNPRLRRELPDEERKPEGLLRHFARTYNLIVLARSMAEKGFAPRHAEALLVVEEEKGADEEQEGAHEYVVVEGNRRLATMLLLSDGERRKSLELPGEWDGLAAMASDKGHSFDPVPAIVYDSREDLAEYLGFRHITGPTAWRPEAKARFIAGLLSHGESIDYVWRRIGSNARTVRRYAEAHAVYEQVLALGIDGDPVEAAFGVFYNALDTPGVRSYLGLNAQRDFENLPGNPVPTDHAGEMREFINLLYGDKEENLPSVLRESRELRQLSAVLLDRDATALLTEERDLQRAYRVAGGGRTELLVLLKDSYARLVQASGQAHEFKTDEDVKTLVRRLRSLVEDMAERYETEEMANE